MYFSDSTYFIFHGFILGELDLDQWRTL